MTHDEEQTRLDGISAEVRQLAEAAYQDLLQRLRDGESPRAAIQAVTATFSGAYYHALSGAFSAVLGREIGVAAIKAWPIADVALSERLYAHSSEVSAVTRRLIAEHAEGFVQARELALRLYEGYQFKVDPLTVKAALPKYLRQAMKDPGVNQSLTRVFSRIRADALKTPALKAAYLQAIDAAEAGAGAERLRKLLRTAWYERNRYFANRIAQTELHRAYSDQVAQDLMADEGIHWVQVVMSRSHPKVDICDYHARLNAYGQGPGVYPKPKAPKPTFHPFCRCVLVPRPDLDGDPDATPIPGADRAFMASLTKDDQRLVAGSRDRLNQFLSGKRLEAIHDAGVRQEYRLRRVGDVIAVERKSAYEIAKQGGDYVGHYQRYKNEYSSRLVRAARSYEKVIQEHRAWIENPASKLGNDVEEEIVRRYVEKKWPQDIARNQAYLDIIEGILMERER